VLLQMAELEKERAARSFVLFAITHSLPVWFRSW